MTLKQRLALIGIVQVLLIGPYLVVQQKLMQLTYALNGAHQELAALDQELKELESAQASLMQPDNIGSRAHALGLRPIKPAQLYHLPDQGQGTTP